MKLAVLPIVCGRFVGALRVNAPTCKLVKGIEKTVIAIVKNCKRTDRPAGTL